MISRLSLICVGLFLFFYSTLIYVNYSQPAFAYTGLKYNTELSNIYLPINVVAISLLLFFVSRDLKPAHLFFFVTYVFVLNGILTAAIYFANFEISFPAVVLVILSCAIIIPLSNFALPIRLHGSANFETIILLLLFAASAIVGMEALQHGLRLVSFTQIYQFRGEVNLSAPGRYAVSLFVFAIGPAAIAVGLWHKNYLLTAAAVGLFIVGYMLTFQKSVLLAPAWVIAMWYFTGFRMARTPVGIFCFLIGPLVVSGLYVFLGLPHSITVLGTIPTRMYTMPGQIFAHYLDFFSRNPHTWFSHISGVNVFIDYPYAQPMPVVIGNAYPGGNQNANFWAQDAIAGAGIWAIPVVSLAFGLVLVLVNSTAKGLDIRFVLTMCTMAAQRFADGTLATGILTGGVGLILIFLVLAPRAVYGYEREKAGTPKEPGLIFA